MDDDHQSKRARQEELTCPFEGQQLPEQPGTTTWLTISTGEPSISNGNPQTTSTNSTNSIILENRWSYVASGSFGSIFKTNYRSTASTTPSTTTPSTTNTSQNGTIIPVAVKVAGSYITPQANTILIMGLNENNQLEDSRRNEEQQESYLREKQSIEREIKKLKLFQCYGSNSDENHPYIVKYYGVFNDYSCTYFQSPTIGIVLEYAEHGSLADVIHAFASRSTKTWIPLSLSCKWLNEILLALVHIHNLKSSPNIHKDLKPGNILLRKSLTIALCDFGGTTSLLSNDASTIFSRYFRAPERRDKSLPDDPRGDVYSFAIVAYNLLTQIDPDDKQQKSHELLDYYSTALNDRIQYLDEEEQCVIKALNDNYNGKIGILRQCAQRITDRPSSENVQCMLQSLTSELKVSSDKEMFFSLFMQQYSADDTIGLDTDLQTFSCPS